MVSYTRSMLQFAAITGAATFLLMAAPAVADEAPVAAPETATETALAVPLPSADPRADAQDRMMAPRYRHRIRHVSQMPADLGCYYGVWCGRQFVLMLGIGF
jgi:hypothetical protein